MKTTVQRWGNSLGLRIPKAFAEQAAVTAPESFVEEVLAKILPLVAAA